MQVSEYGNVTIDKLRRETLVTLLNFGGFYLALYTMIEGTIPQSM